MMIKKIVMECDLLHMEESLNVLWDVDEIKEEKQFTTIISMNDGVLLEECDRFRRLTSSLNLEFYERM